MSREQIAARLLHIPETSESPGEKSELGTSKPYKAKSLACLRAELLDADRELLEVTRTYEGLVRQRTGGQVRQTGNHNISNANITLDLSHRTGHLRYSSS